MTSIIRTESLVKTYTLGGSVIHALDHVSFEVEEGETVAIMGPSGSGKSTLMHIIGCLDTPTSGQYLFKGRDITSLSDLELAR